MFSFFKKRYIYQNNKGLIFQIEGNVFDPNFKVFYQNQVLIEVSSYTSFISLRSHSYCVKILNDDFDIYETINLVEGIRNLVEAQRSGGSSSGSH